MAPAYCSQDEAVHVEDGIFCARSKRDRSVSCLAYANTDDRYLLRKTRMHTQGTHFSQSTSAMDRQFFESWQDPFLTSSQTSFPKCVARVCDECPLESAEHVQGPEATTTPSATTSTRRDARTIEDPHIDGVARSPQCLPFCSTALCEFVNTYNIPIFPQGLDPLEVRS